MDTFIEAFPHIAEEIFQQLDDKSLTNCREVARSWSVFIDDRNLSWIRIIKSPTTLSYRSTRSKYLSPGSTYLHLAAVTGQAVVFKDICEDEENKNPPNDLKITPLHCAVAKGYFEIVNFLIQKQVKFSYSNLFSIQH